jgi:hypothetical protein
LFNSPCADSGGDVTGGLAPDAGLRIFFIVTVLSVGYFRTRLTLICGNKSGELF